MSSVNPRKFNASSISFLSPDRMQAINTFLAYDETIKIIPTFSYKQKMDFLLTQKSIGPLIAGTESTVPLWVGLYLRKRNLCRIKCPPWMTVDHLKKVLAHERNVNENSFSKDLPFRYAEISTSLLSAVGARRSAMHAAGGREEEISNADLVKLLLEDISAVRMHKIRQNVHTMSVEYMGDKTMRAMPEVDVTGIGSVEIAIIRPFLEGAFQDHLKLMRAGTTPITQKTQNPIPIRDNKSRPAEQDQGNDVEGLKQNDANDQIEADSDSKMESNETTRRSVRRYRS